MIKARIEAFSDGVFAIIITIMILEMKAPHEASFTALINLFPVFISYMFSFIFIGTYWANHHHLLHTAQLINTKIIWANLALLFFVSFIPFSTGWIGQTHFGALPIATYATNLLLSAIAFYVLQNVITLNQRHTTKLSEALVEQKKKGLVSLLMYIIAIPFAFLSPIISELLLIFVAVLWLLPDKNIEHALTEDV
jgi:uncharacterized membrane protein